jgi:hypothetical protein
MEHIGMHGRLARVIELFDNGRISSDEFKAAISLAGTLNRMLDILVQAYIVALTHKRHRIAQAIRSVNIDHIEPFDAGFQLLELEPSWDLWQAFVFPVEERKIDEWFSNPWEAKVIVTAKVESLGCRLEELKARLNIGEDDCNEGGFTNIDLIDLMMYSRNNEANLRAASA